MIGHRNSSGDHTFVDTPLAIAPGIWNRIQVAFDLKKFHVTVNGKKWAGGQARRGFAAKAFSFGGDICKKFLPSVPVKFFAGDLRSLRIRHGFFPDAAPEK